MVAAAIIGGAVVAGTAGAIGSSSAAHTQAAAADRANAQLAAQQAQTRSDLMPYQNAGQQGLNDLTSRMGDLTSPFNMTQANLEATPGYQFNLSQGLKATNNALGARGLLNSGAVMKGASSYATGLADSTYQNQFNMDQANKQNAYNKLMGVAQLGENAASQTGAYGTQIANMVSNNTIGQGNAIAAGQIGVANGFATVGNALSSAGMMRGMGYGSNMGGIFGSGGGGSFGGGPLSAASGLRAASPSYGGQG